ncbi:uncharacterized protein TNIN_142041 [Trichonephila inaurata madagascariensis]|uniref:Uncharacterized protein n=1 Tax=Trichonephila inaurata madagascariensis TaxID=2747483 RepID=A0A8X6XMC1_9ARAC|nr:uncharacterized protein TNIN_142041 [Trichonephila inaurata madagascariensis]
MPLHKRCHLDSSKSSDHPLMSSGSEGSTCDACSEILRSSDPCDHELMYSSSASSMKASSCRIHYRWPSCLSRWGQSSTTTASDVDSVDTVSIILSDFHGSQAATMSKANGHGQSLSCLCDTQGTWPFNQCTKCGRQFYSRASLQSSRKTCFIARSRWQRRHEWIQSSLDNGLSRWFYALQSTVQERICLSVDESTFRPGATNNGVFDCDFTCTCGKGDPYANYAVPRSATMLSKDISCGSKDAKMYLPDPTEDYDDMMSNCDMTQKNSAMKSINNGPSCSCMSACKIVQNIELFKMASKHSHSHKHGPLNSTSGDPLQMCACQRVMLWAGSLVPCLGPQRSTLETGWQCTKSLTTDGTGCSRTWFNHTAAVCSEPHRTAEVVMKNGKLKHVLREASADLPCDMTRTQTMRNPLRPRASTVSYSLSTKQADTSETNYANIEFPSNSEGKLVKVSDDNSTVNYANIEFAETLPLYENSNVVLSRLETEDKKEPIVPNKPPLPPRCHMNASKKFSESMDKDDKCKCKQVSVNRSPKKTADRQMNGSAYEMMCYQKNPAYNQQDEDYLMMQPLCMKDEKSSSPSKQITENTEPSNILSVSVQNGESEVEVQENLPLRPFMPYSYPVAETLDSVTSENVTGDSMTRKNQLISEDLHLRAMRSNSLSELKKKVLMRKRSSSVDGKNNGYQSKDSGVESVPASPVGSPRPSVTRKNSLFSKLSLRSKEKSMSTNEIDLPLPMPNGHACTLNNSHKKDITDRQTA